MVSVPDTMLRKTTETKSTNAKKVDLDFISLYAYLTTCLLNHLDVR